jgi:hypothetical protein
MDATYVECVELGYINYIATEQVCKAVYVKLNRARRFDRGTEKTVYYRHNLHVYCTYRVR